MTKTRMWFLVGVVVLIAAPAVLATELVYTPVNPSFGGNPLNGSFLLSQAEAQNKHKAPQDSLLSSRDPLEDFEASLNRRILSILANRIVDSAFGDTGTPLEPGRFEIGDFVIDVAETPDGSPSITIIDQQTGNTTLIEIPSF